MPLNRILIPALFVASAVAAAQTTPRATIGGIPTAQPQSPNAAHRHAAALNNGACQRILEECRRQGFIQGQYERDNGLWRDCFDPVVKGGEPTQNGHPVHVAVSPSDVQACRSAESHRKTQARAY